MRRREEGGKKAFLLSLMNMTAAMQGEEEKKKIFAGCSVTKMLFFHEDISLGKFAGLCDERLK